MDDAGSFSDSLSSSPSVPEEDIDFSLVYSLHTFLATVDGQASVVKGDKLSLLDDSNSYWWLVRVLKTQMVGYIPAENIETPYERLARLNKHRNVGVSCYSHLAFSVLTHHYPSSHLQTTRITLPVPILQSLKHASRRASLHLDNLIRIDRNIHPPREYSPIPPTRIILEIFLPLTIVQTLAKAKPSSSPLLPIMNTLQMANLMIMERRTKMVK